jgi:hypothetical protein
MRRTTLGPLNTTDLNISSSLDTSMVSVGGENYNNNASSRKSLSTSGIGKMLTATTKQAPGTGKKASNHRQSVAPTTSTTNDRYVDKNNGNERFFILPLTDNFR